MKISVETEGTMVLVARYCYPEGIVQPSQAIVVADRDPLAVKGQNGAIGFDFAEVYEFSCGEKHFQCVSVDSETFYWGQELSLEELRALPDYAETEHGIGFERFVLTGWGAVLPISTQGRVIPHPSVFDLPADMRPSQDD